MSFRVKNEVTAAVACCRYQVMADEIQGLKVLGQAYLISLARSRSSRKLSWSSLLPLMSLLWI